MSLGANEFQELVNTVRTSKVVGEGVSGDNYVAIYNIPERLEAANKLASAKATEFLVALQDFFVELLMKLNLTYDTDQNGFHHHAFPSDMRYLVKSLLSMSGTEAFNSMMISKVLPALEDEAVDLRQFYSEKTIRSKQIQKLSFLQSEFGRIGEWENQAAIKIANYESKNREEEEMKRQAEEEHRITILKKRKSQQECTMCGRPLVIIDRLMKREKHQGCKVFKA